MQLSASLFGYVVFHSALMWAVGNAQDGPLVSTRNGNVLGKYINTTENRQVSAFLGIPFGQPPIGKLRFADPLPALSWSPKIYEATQYGDACYHLNDTTFPGFRGAEMWNSPNKSEDCLYLNIWVSKNTKPTERLAVMVWIYGGGYFSGSSSLSVYDGATLADQSDVIVVSFNYRLGPLGFMPPVGDTSGNAGFHDQILALKWVRDNIANFGGDPDQITLFGESAGSASVGLHTVSPLSRGLFNRVILQSGPHTTQWFTNDLATAKSRMKVLANTLMCPETNDETLILSCLQSREAIQIYGASWLVGSDFSFPFAPTTGTKALPDEPREVLRRGGQAPVDMLIGWNSKEGSYFTIYGFPGYNISTESHLTREEYVAGIVRAEMNLNAIGQEAVAFFYSDWTNPSNPAQYRDGLNEAIGDFQFVCPLIQIAKSHRKRANVFTYHFSYRHSYNPWPEWMGVMHGYEIELVFGLPFSHDRAHEYNNKDRQVSMSTVRYWTNFAKYGNPNGPPSFEETRDHRFKGQDTYWPPVGDKEFEYLEISATRNYVRRSPSALQCAFFEKYIPSLQAASSKWSDTESRWKLQFRRWEDYMDSWESSYYHYKRDRSEQKCLN